MVKNDCSVTVIFLKEWRRMCDSFHDCSICVLGMRDEFGINRCKANDNPGFTIEIVQKWSDAHPVKTRLDDLLEKYPKFEVFSETGRPMYKPRMFGYCTDCSTCPNNKAEHCWNEPVDGGATGKAVE